MRAAFLFLAAALTLLADGPRYAAPSGSAGKRARAPQVRITDYRLDNGLRVILAPDRTAPVVAVSVTYNVGSRDERRGRTGFAHLFEHMMFQGSENVGRGEHPMLVGDNGGTMNGTTNQDRTNYFEAVPANQLDLILYLEADRMRALDISQENLDNQRAVVQEERRQNYDNRPHGTVYETILGMAYTSFPYQHSTIGSMEDLNAATLEDVRSFFKTYYAPNNAALALAGDFDVKDARAKIKKHFGSIPKQPAPPPVTVTEPPGAGERRKVLTDRLARLAEYTSAYVTVPGNHPDYYALRLLADLLADGRSSRLYPALVEKQIASTVSAFQMESRGPGLFVVDADVPPGGDSGAVEKAIDAEIRRVIDSGVTEEEMRKARVGARTEAVARLGSALGRANTLSQAAIYYDDPHRINTLLPRLEAVTAADIQRVAAKYLTRNNRVVVVSQPAGERGGAGRTEP